MSENTNLQATVPSFAYPRPPAAFAAGLALLGVLIATVALPLATYTTALAFFGLAHVGSELRYVGYRFGASFRGAFGACLAALLAAAVLARLSGMQGWLPFGAAVALEVLAGAIMTAAAAAYMGRRRLAGALIAATLLAGASIGSFQTLLFLAIAHNLTPLAFFADAIEGAARRRVLACASFLLVGLPLLIATGAPYRALAQFGLVNSEATLLVAGPLADNLRAYVPEALIGSPWALHVFSAAVFAQCMHYVAVIGVLPQLIPPTRARRPTAVPWPSGRWFAAGMTICAAAFACAFAVDFNVSRQVYALVALVHAWIEIPVLVLALDRGEGRASHQPRGVEDKAEGA